MEQTWRWYGPQDSVTLSDVRQAGATGIVTALHHLPNGAVWSREEILQRKTCIEQAGLRWSVVESIPVHEEIKTHSGDYRKWTENYQQSLRNLASCGIRVVCYNFMPILDWTRTDLAWPMPDGSRALRFDHLDFAAFELFLLEREGAWESYSATEIAAARERFDSMDRQQREQLTANIIAGLPGAEEGYSLESLREQLARYRDIDKARLRENFAWFLQQIIPVAEEVGVRMALHPDDPPRPILGLPRIVSTVEDMRWLVSVSDSPSNGFTFCTGSYGVREDNDLPAMLREFAHRVWFTHLRATRREGDPLSFHEADHLDGDVDMFAIVHEILQEEQRRGEPLPMRPDHGHQMLDDLQKSVNPGYSAIGRLRGLAELRGLELGIRRAFFATPNR